MKNLTFFSQAKLVPGTLKVVPSMPMHRKEMKRQLQRRKFLYCLGLVYNLCQCIKRDMYTIVR